MVTVGIIAEFNPLHKGHEYIIRKAREITKADCVVIVMSGNFMQRGDIAIAPKHTRAKAAINCGADIVFELPFAYATSSAEIFAQGGLSLLNSLGVDYIAFGSESGDITRLTAAATILANETNEFKQILNDNLALGLSFPAAREKAFLASGGDADIFTPNNILAIEYIKAIIKTNSTIKPVTIKREGAGYNDTAYYNEKHFISASAFRYKLESITDIHEGNEFLYNTLPPKSASLMINEHNKVFPLFNNDLMPLLRYSLLMNSSYLCDFADFTPALAERFNNLKEKKGNDIFANGYEELVLSLKTKDMTAARIKRALLHTLTGFTTVNAKEAMELALEGSLPYARLLAFGVQGQAFLKKIRKESELLIINSLGKAQNKLTYEAKNLISFDIISADIYASAIFSKFNYTYPDEYRLEIVKTQ